MKVLLLLLIFLVSNLCFSQGKYLDYKFENTSKKKARYFVSKKKLSDGTWQTTVQHANGIIYCSGIFQRKNDTVKNGWFSFYSFQGLLEKTAKYKNGFLEDTVREYIANGAICDLQVYDKGIKNGLHETYLLGEIALREYYVDGQVDGQQVKFYRKDTVSTQTQYVNGFKHGKFIRFYESGELNVISHYAEDELHGSYVSYYEDGQVEDSGRYELGVKDGAWSFYHDNGQQSAYEVYNLGEIQEIRFWEEDRTEVFGDLNPEEFVGMFVNGVSFKEYLNSIIEYPASARELGVQGKVYTKLVIEKDGTITNIKTERGVSLEIDREVKRCIKTIDKLEFGKSHNRLSRITMRFPITFSLH